MQEVPKNRRTALYLSLLGLGMFGFGFAMVPLYGLICQVTGIQSASASPAATPRSLVEQPADRIVTVKFDATVQSDLPWEFTPALDRVEVPVGRRQQVTYTVRNRASHPVTGQAIPAVVPWQATGYFNKAECFCFTNQTLGPGETREMPVVFLVSPELPEGIDSLALSYTFMNVDAVRGTAPR